MKYVAQAIVDDRFVYAFFTSKANTVKGIERAAMKAAREKDIEGVLTVTREHGHPIYANGALHSVIYVNA